MTSSTYESQLPYLGVSLTVSAWLALQHGMQYAPLLPLAFATMHLAYGSGFIAGVARFVLLPRPRAKKLRTV